MNILIIGGGGREHAIAKYIAKNPSVKKIYALPGNGGISKIAECVK
ncbi:MAG: phosphoribosylamine--glycine ligase, partial [Synergistaceae bacterium]|nr:phosphoribosylamine--glycine ligase [Synergistaceae bacterium]